VETSQHELNEEIPTLRRDNTEEYEPAGVLIRFAASIVDSITISFLLLPFNILQQVLAMHESKLGMVVVTILSYICSFSLIAWFLSKKGGLPGKLLLGLKIIDVKTGSFVTPGKAIGRETAGKLLSALTLMIGYFMAGIRKDKKALHDIICGTQVIKKVKKNDL